MQLKWYGHSCFLMTAEDGTRILTDPCDPSTGYTLSGIETDVVTVSHGHFDHNYLAAAAGDPLVIDTAGAHTACGVTITGVPTWHDEVQGAKRGPNIAFIYEIDGLRIAHLGDLGEVPAQGTLDVFGHIDVLLVPVGGFYTIDAEAARQVANLLRPSVVVPMHYKTPVIGFPIAGVDRLLSQAQGCSIHRMNEPVCTLSAASLGEDRIIVLDYAKE